MIRVFIGLAIAMLLTFSGCGFRASGPQIEQGANQYECIVCKYNADLACLDIGVTKDTPHAFYQGKQYYFCSEECRSNFLNNPDEYLESDHHET